MPATYPSPTTVSTRRHRLAAASLALALAFGAALPARADDVNRVVLRVNDRIITLYDFRDRLADRQRTIRRSDLPPDQMMQNLAAAPSAVLREMMDEVLLLSRGDQLSVEVAEDKIDQAVLQTRKNMGLEDDEQYRSALSQAGMTERDFRVRLRDNMMFQEVLGREVRSKIKVDAEQMQRYYREHPAEFRVPAQYKLREIVVLDRPGQSAGDQASLAAQLRAALGSGSTLEKLAAQYSGDGRTSAVIDLGSVQETELDAKLREAVAATEANGYTAPTPGRGGLHILQVVERQPARVREFSEVQDQLEAAEKNRKFQKELADYMDELERSALVIADPPIEAANFRVAHPRAPGEAEGLEGLATEPAKAPETTASPQAPAAATTAATPPAKPAQAKPPVKPPATAPASAPPPVKPPATAA